MLKAVPSGINSHSSEAAMTDGKANHAEVLEAGKAAAHDMARVMTDVIRKIGEH